jgi:DNA-binding response OmpR family regulator
MESQIKILLVEDNPGDARLLNEYLSESQISSFSVVNASSIQQAGQCLERDGKFDIILLDLSLPDSQGLATVSQLRSICPDKALVVLTGLDDESAGIEALRQGAQDYLVKGQATPRILGRAIFHSIARRKIELEREELLEALKKARDELELRVKERTRDLQRTVDALQSEIVARIQAEDALRESNELLERMFDSIYLNVAYMDADFSFIRVNRAFSASEGQEPE